MLETPITRLRTSLAHAVMLGALCALVPVAKAQEKPVKNVVLVHGAWAD